VDGLIEAFVAEADVKLPFACARICATSGDTSPNENGEILGVTVAVVLFIETKGTFVVVVAVVLLLFTDVTLLDIDDEVSYVYFKNLFFSKTKTK
jgi:hypothetical protein